VTDVTLSLVSHTNVGKTTLARTLLRRDVGQVLDQPHVTDVSEAFTAIEAQDARLLLWDTPGLGDTVRLLRRLRSESNPIGWFLHQVWDRNRNRPLWCSQEALRNVREDADVVLYLVSGAESPGDAGYVTPELEILSWLGRPTLVLLNQTGTSGRASRRLLEEWREFVAAHPVVRGLLPLDAFARSWVQEDVLFDHVVPLLEGEKRAAMERLAAAWHARNQQVFERCMRLIAAQIARTASDREPLPGPLASRAQKKEAMASLAARLERSQEALWDEAVAAHGLEGSYAAEVRRQLDAFVVSGERPLTPERGALIGSVLSGALGGLAADLFSGGLSLGGGLLAGAILGALGGAGLSHAVRLLDGGGRPAVSWGPAFLDRLVERSLLRYLALAHFGRGRGRFEAESEPEAWRAEVASALAGRRERLTRLWKEAAAQGSPGSAALEPALGAALTEATQEILRGGPPAGRES